MVSRSCSTVSLVLAILGGCQERTPDCTQQAPQPTGCPPSSSAALLPGHRSIADVADQVTPSVVSIISEQPPRGARDPFWRRQFGPSDRGIEYSLGSGVIVSSDGVIVTSSHVVAHGESIRVALKNGQTLDAKVVGIDPDSDVAVIRVDAKDLTPIRIADSSKLRTGDVVLAVGNPFGVGQTVTMGIVSAVGRSNMGITSYDDFIQTDAAINPGNSGGALVDMEGQLVGINTAIISRTGGYEGIGFAIPSRTAMLIKDSLLKDGKVIRGWLGITIQDLTDELARSLGVEPRTGVLISDVAPDGPAANAGLRRGDVITAINGAQMTSAAQLRNLIALTARGTRARLEIVRNDTPRSIQVIVGEQPSETAGANPLQPDEAGLFAGVVVQDLDPSLRARLRVPAELQGVVVRAIEPDSPAALMGLRVGDLIMEVNRAPTPSTSAFTKAVRANRRRALALVYRDGATIFISVAAQDE
ncbi:MAG: protease [Myxococcales bacterium]|nr:protease [Myxococcales bacterium]